MRVCVCVCLFSLDFFLRLWEGVPLFSVAFISVRSFICYYITIILLFN